MKAVIVGAGLSSAVVAASLIRKGWEVEVFEARGHIGGNCYDFDDITTGIKIHRYGPHAFHTNDKRVWDFVNQFSKFTQFRLQVHAKIESGEIIPIPFNDISMDIVGDWDSQRIIDELFKTYSKKHWGCEWEELPRSITSRVPKRRETRDLSYHLDEFQGLPVNGYTKMIEAMFEGATIHLNCGYEDWKKSSYDLLVYTGSIDSYYNYYLGTLAYRSLRFEFKEEPTTKYIQLNQCNSEKHTRQIDHSHWYSATRFRVEKTIMSREYSEEFSIRDMGTDRFYPKSFQSQELYENYKNIYNPKVLFLGRLGTYKYMDMDICIAQALKAVEKI